MKTNTVYNEDCIITMGNMPDDYIDLTITSPPYDNLRNYKNLDWSEIKWQKIIQALYRVTKIGGVVVWVVGDATVKGSETGSSFKQALHFMTTGFRLHDTMIYMKSNPKPLNCRRYEQQFEYIFVFSKERPKTFNPIMIPCKYAGVKNFGKRKKYNPDGSFEEFVYSNPINDTKVHGNVFEYRVGNNKAVHPAIMPKELAYDQLITWSNDNDLIYDPFAGSGTVGLVAIENNRNFILSEIVNEYCDSIRTTLQNFGKRL